MVAYDGSEPSWKAIEYAASLASERKVKLIIVTVVPKPTYPIPTGEHLEASVGSLYLNLDERVKDTYGQALEKASRYVRKLDPGVELELVLLEGKPSDRIVEEVKKRDVNLLVIGSHGIGGVTGWILGSTSKKVVENIDRPVLIIK